MKTLIMIFIIALNIFSIVMLMKMLKGCEIKTKVITIVVLEVIMLIHLSIIYGIAAIGIPANVASTSKGLIMSTFLPINVMIIAAPIALQINKAQTGETEKNSFAKSIIKIVMIAILVTILECIYIKNVQNGIAQMSNNNA